MSAPRVLSLLGVGLGGGVVLGALSGMMFFPPAGLVIGGIFGVFVGAASWVVVFPALMDRELAPAVAVGYAPACLVALISGAGGPVFAIPATGCAFTLGLLGAYLWCPKARPRFGPGRCRECGYDLLGITVRRCPECGADDPRAAPGRPREPFVIVWLAMVVLTLGALATIAFVPIARTSIGLSSSDPARLMELMGKNDMAVHDRAGRQLKAVAPEVLIREAIVHSNDGVRRQAARQLRFGFEDNAEAFAALIRALNDPDAHVRMEVAVTLGYIGNPDAIPQLQNVVDEDPSSMVVRKAREAIDRLNSG